MYSIIILKNEIRTPHAIGAEEVIKRPPGEEPRRRRSPTIDVARRDTSYATIN
jgi:hypothetical protein